MAHENHQNTVQLRDSIRGYLNRATWANPVAVSLTLKQRIKQQKLALYDANCNFRHFMNRLNRKAFGSSGRRNNHRLGVIGVVEHDELVRFHYHAIIDRPDHMDFEIFEAAVRTSWLKTTWGYREMVIAPMTSPGWVNYITKLDQKPDYDLAIDWMNARIH